MLNNKLIFFELNTVYLALNLRKYKILLHQNTPLRKVEVSDACSYPYPFNVVRYSHCIMQ